MSAGDRVRQAVEPLLAHQGMELVDVGFSGATLRVTIDRTDGEALDLDTVALASQIVSEALDRADPIPGRYVLEVSSPGIERPLRTPEQFRRAVGATVAVKTRAGTDGDRRVDGVLDSADDNGIVVGGRALAYSEIERARTTFEWGKTAGRKGGGTKKPPPPSKASQRNKKAYAS